MIPQVLGLHPDFRALMSWDVVWAVTPLMLPPAIPFDKPEVDVSQ